jgi:pectate lyase
MFYEFTGLKDSEACGKVIKGKSGIAFASSGLRFVSDKGSAPNTVIDINLSSCGGVGSASIFTPPYSYTLKSADVTRDYVKANAGAGKL